MAVVVAAEVGLVLVHAGVALVAEGAVEGLLGLAGGGGLRGWEGEVALGRWSVVGWSFVLSGRRSWGIVPVNPL